jgi:hypothetical protein
MSKNRLLLLFTNHRVAEKLWPVIPKLSEIYTLDLFLVGLFSDKTPWIGDIDERHLKVKEYNQYIDNVIMGPGVKFHGDNVTSQLSEYVNLDLYKAVIFDDNRAVPEFNVPNFYKECKLKNIKVIGNSHGNEDYPHNAIGTSYDYAMDFKSGGIPANDTLKNVVCSSKHILIITNFLGLRNMSDLFPLGITKGFDEHFFNECGVLELSNTYKLPVKIKIKPRLDYPDYEKEVNYIKSFLPPNSKKTYNIIVNTDNIDQLIADSAVVISAPSTLAFKPIQLGIPTVLIKETGITGEYFDYPGLVELNKQKIFDSIQKQVNHGKYSEWIKLKIAGGNTFTSTDVYIQKIKELI